MYTGDIVDGRRQLRLVVDESESEFLSGKVTATAGVNGSYLGPTLRMRRGDDVDFIVDNRLSEIRTMHWHGMHVPAMMGGTPHQTIDSGEHAEILVDFRAGKSATMKSFPDAGLLQTVESFFDGAGSGHYQLLDIRVNESSGSAQRSPLKIERLNEIVRLEPNESVKTRTMALGGPLVRNANNEPEERIPARNVALG